MAYDLFAPFCRVTILPSEGDAAGWTFDVGRWPQSNDPATDTDRGGPFVKSVSVTVNQGGQHDGLTIGIEAPYREGVLLIEQGCFDFLNYATAQIGYLGGAAEAVTEVYAGFLDKGGEGLGLTAEAVSGSISAAFLQARQADFLKSTATVKPSPDLLKDQEALAALEKALGKLTGAKGKANAAAIAAKTAARDALKAKCLAARQAAIGGGRTALALLTEHAEAAGFVATPLGAGGAAIDALSSAVGAKKDAEETFFGVSGNVGHMDIVKKILFMANVDWHIGAAANAVGPALPALYYYEKGYAASLAPIAALTLRGVFNPTATPPQYPILDVTFNAGAAAWHEGRKWGVPKPAAATAGVRAAYINKDTGVLGSEFADPLGVLRPFSALDDAPVSATAQDDARPGGPKADTAADPAKGEAAALTVAAPAGTEQAAAKGLAMATVGGAADDMAMTLTVTTLGMPLVQPGQPIAVHGCSRTFDATYVVKKVTHNYAAGDWKTALELARWGTLSANRVKGASPVQTLKDDSGGAA
jgi:hypothetical protein